MKVVCDTNVLVAGMVADGLCRDIVKRRLLRTDLITSRVLLDELARTLRNKFDTDPAEVPLLKAYRERATLVRPKAHGSLLHVGQRRRQVISLAETVSPPRRGPTPR